jgi:hypothetical protein
MKLLRLRLPGICVLLLLLSSLASAASRKTLRAEIPGASTREFAVENLLGAVRVSAGTGDTAVVVAHVFAESDELAAQVRLEEVRGEGAVRTLRVRYPATHRTLRYRDPDQDESWDGLSFGDGSKCQYDGRTYRVSSRRGRLLYAEVEVRVPPRLAAATFLNFAGRLEAEGIEGKLAFRVSSADLRLDRLHGDVDVRGSSGDMRAADIRGSWRSEFSSGDCELSNLEGASVVFVTSSGDVTARSLAADRLSIETSSGDYRISDADLRKVETESSSGDILLELRGRRLESLRADSSSGDVRIVLPHDHSFRAQADQGSGDMRVRFEDGERGYRREELVSFRRGSGGADIRVTTSSGDLAIEPR